MSKPPYSLGIDIGGTKTAAAVVTTDGALIGYNHMPTPATRGPAAIIDAAVRVAQNALAASTQPVTVCGIGTAGVVDSSGTITHSTNALTDWKGTNLTQRFGAALHLPVTVLNDVHATALGETRRGVAAGFHDTLTIAIGTGIGGAITHDGELITGATGTAGSIGHMTIPAPTARRCTCGRWNHLEAYAAGPAIESCYAEVTSDPIPLPAIAANARNGHPQASAVITAAAEHLGLALGEIVNLLDPDVIVITGGVAALHDLISDTIQHTIATQALPGPDHVQLRFSSLGTHATILGAASVAQAHAPSRGARGQ